ncbi:MAG: hypothetical protein IKJ73_02375 [Lachnospiraceae bacterium]|nr:hypothetical protein [Lachnospiraceae bacterium]
MSRQLSLHFLLPIEGYEEDKIYKSEDIELSKIYHKQIPDNVYYRQVKEKSVYASTKDIVEFVRQKYLLGKINSCSMCINRFGEYEIKYQDNKYIVTKDELNQLEREHITESIYCNELRYCSLSWFYTNICDELLPEGVAIVDDELIQKASSLLGYDSENILAMRLADVIEEEADGNDKFIASLILAREIASHVNGRAVLWYD